MLVINVNHLKKNIDNYEINKEKLMIKLNDKYII